MRITEIRTSIYSKRRDQQSVITRQNYATYAQHNVLPATYGEYSISFGCSKQECVANLLKVAKQIIKIVVEKNLLEWEECAADLPPARSKEITNLLAEADLKVQKLAKTALKKALSSFEQIDASKLDDTEKALIKLWNDTLKKYENIPEEFLNYKIQLISRARSVWAKAMENNDFASFSDTLAEMFIAARKDAKYLCSGETPHDNMLNYTGHTAAEISNIFTKHKNDLVPLAEVIIDKNNMDKTLLDKPTKTEQWQNFSLLIAKEMGLDMSKVTLGQTPASFMLGIDSPKRIAIAISNREPTIAGGIKIFTAFIHESGHGLVETGGAEKLYRTGLSSPELDLHESQSLLWENMVGRSKEFWQHYYPSLQKEVDALKDVDMEDFYKALNAVTYSPIRVRADEVTYNLHVILRHEIEAEIFDPKNSDEDIRRIVKNLPQIWNDKMQKYLKYTPKNDAEGVLQDRHWADSATGYFPAYGLGNLMAAQIMHQAQIEIPGLYNKIAAGDLKTLSKWLKEKIYKYGGTYSAAEVMKKVTGEELNPKYFIEYLKAKYLN